MNNDRSAPEDEKPFHTLTAEAKAKDEKLLDTMRDLAFDNADNLHQSCKVITDFLSGKRKPSLFQSSKKFRETNLTNFLVAIANFEVKINIILKHKDIVADSYARNMLMFEVFRYLYSAPGTMRIEKPAVKDTDIILKIKHLFDDAVLGYSQLSELEKLQSEKVKAHMAEISDMMLTHISNLSSALGQLFFAVNQVDIDEGEELINKMDTGSNINANMQQIFHYLIRKNQKYVDEERFLAAIPPEVLYSGKESHVDDQIFKDLNTYINEYNTNQYLITLNHPDIDQLTSVLLLLEKIQRLINQSFTLPVPLEKTLTHDVKKNIQRIEKEIDTYTKEASLTRTTPESENRTPESIRRGSDSK